jgi:ATP-dependent helicase HepA
MFCIAKGHEFRGIGKVLSFEQESCTIEYFDTPNSKERKTLTRPKNTVVRKRLEPNTRIYYFHNTSEEWLVGRVLQDNDDGVEVRFSDKRDLSLSYESLFVRCKKPIEDPVDFLANVITETPQYTESRRYFLNSYIRQRSVTHGISALLSSAIEMEAHQIDVIRKILSDPIQKYLLADEVGLGKTIEAGVIVRQIALDDPKSHNIIVLTPRSLVEQWKSELESKFFLQDFVDISIHVLPFDDERIGRKFIDNIDLLVIDEAHHLADSDDPIAANAYDEVSSNLDNIERVLLLSATPILRNELGFLRMLHLIDPVVYNQKDINAFKLKVENRKSLAESVSSLDPQNVLFLDPILDQLLIDLPNDALLRDLVSSLKVVLVGLPDEEDPEVITAIRRVKTHLSETYKLNRRILRNRRKKVTGLTPMRNGVEVTFIPDQSLAQLEQILENWRIEANYFCRNNSNELASEEFRIFYWSIICCLFSGQKYLRSLIDTRLKFISENQINGLENEIKILDQMKAAFNYENWIDLKIESLNESLSAILDKKQKIIIFTSLSEEADLIYENLKTTHGAAVVRYQVIDRDEIPDPNNDWRKFNLDPVTKIIICDQRAEEGINLQGGKRTIFHFDLPLAPNRLEQRMGRVDRYGSGDPIQTFTLLDEDYQFQALYVKLLNDSLGIFNQSVSTLQYLIEEKFSSLKNELFYGGLESLDTLQKALEGPNGEVAKELKSINRQDTLDELAPLSEEVLDDLNDTDADWRGIKEAFNYWACDTLLFSQIPDTPAVNKTYYPVPMDPAYRYLYRIPGTGKPATLIPMSGFLTDFTGVLDYDDRRSTSKTPLSHAHVTRRQTAVKECFRPLRYGDSFVEALKAFSDFDDRGRSAAMWRQILAPIPKEIQGMYFRFDFLIEANIQEALEFLVSSGITKPNSARSSLTRRSDALFPPLIISLWVNEEGDRVQSDLISKYLELPYNRDRGDETYKDTNLKSLRFRALMQKMPNEFDNWNARCFRMREFALGYIKNNETLNKSIKTAIATAKVDDELRETQLKTRIQLLRGIEAQSEQNQLEIQNVLSSLISNGIRHPSIKIDATGLTILTNQIFPLE